MPEDDYYNYGNNPEPSSQLGDIIGGIALVIIIVALLVI